MSVLTARRIVLAAPIDGSPELSDFRLESFELNDPADGQFLVRNAYCSVDPGTRSRLSAGVSYTSQLKPGEMVTSFALGQVIASRNASYSVGDWVLHASGWSEMQMLDGRGYLQKIDSDWTGGSGAAPRIPLSAWIGVLGIPGMTAWFGVKRVGALLAGDRVLVTSAAGPVGASAGQVARKHGASLVVGVAGGPTKCTWLERQAGFDRAIDYKAVRKSTSGNAQYAAELTARLQAASPEGYDVLFDNVGNEMIDLVIPLLRPRARIVVSGTVAEYNRPADHAVPLYNTRHFIAKRLRMEGILVFDDRRQFPAAQSEMAQWIERGEFAWREERYDGIEKLPEAFIGLFTGETFGRRIVKVGPDATDARGADQVRRG